jgi:hypothetical protein
MEYYLCAARGNNRSAMTNMARNFSYGEGVAVDKYKALEWFNQSRDEPNSVEELNQEGIHLTKEDKSNYFMNSSCAVDQYL